MLFRSSRFLSTQEEQKVGVILRGEVSSTSEATTNTGADAEMDAKRTVLNSQDAPSCHACGSIIVRNGSCYKCMECGETSGCS